MSDMLSQLFVNGLISASFYALCGVSWGVIYRTTRIFHFAHHLVFAIAAYAAVMTTSKAHLPYFLGLFSAVVAAIIFGCGTDAFLYRYLRKKEATRETTFLASMGLGIAGVAILLLIFSSTPYRLEGFPSKVLSVGEAFFTLADLTLVIGCWVALILLGWFLKKSRWGKAILAVGSNMEMARNVGLDIEKMYLLVFAIGSALFGIAAFLFTAKNVAVPTMGMFPLLIGFTTVFLGGVNSLPGHALAGAIIGFSENLGMLILPGEYRTMIAFAILFVVIVIRPKGLIYKRGA